MSFYQKISLAKIDLDAFFLLNQMSLYHRHFEAYQLELKNFSQTIIMSLIWSYITKTRYNS